MNTVHVVARNFTVFVLLLLRPLLLAEACALVEAAAFRDDPARPTHLEDVADAPNHWAHPHLKEFGAGGFARRRLPHLAPDQALADRLALLCDDQGHHKRSGTAHRDETSVGVRRARRGAVVCVISPIASTAADQEPACTRAMQSTTPPISETKHRAFVCGRYAVADKSCALMPRHILKTCLFPCTLSRSCSRRVDAPRESPAGWCSHTTIQWGAHSFTLPRYPPTQEFTLSRVGVPSLSAVFPTYRSPQELGLVSRLTHVTTLEFVLVAPLFKAVSGCSRDPMSSTHADIETSHSERKNTPREHANGH